MIDSNTDPRLFQCQIFMHGLRLEFGLQWCLPIPISRVILLGIVEQHAQDGTFLVADGRG